MSFMATVLRIGSGVIVWAAHFGVVYGGTALACARGAFASVPPLVGVATTVAVVALVATGWTGYRRRDVFEEWLRATLAGFGLIGVIYAAIPVLIVPLCG
jgi:hypothetical protein